MCAKYISKEAKNSINLLQSLPLNGLGLSNLLTLGDLGQEEVGLAIQIAVARASINAD